MGSRGLHARGLTILLAGLALAAPAYGDVFGDVLYGLDYAGFEFDGEYNPLSQGSTLTIGQNFQNTTLDFGFTDLTLTGPVVATVTTASRGIRQLEFSIIGGTANSPLYYNYLSDIGANSVNIDGSAVFNATGSINQFGWYDMRFQLSSRQEVTSTGRYANSDGEYIDFDIGPIDVSGNLFADLLATITDPFYEAAGYENIFATFSGRTMRENALESTVSQAKAKMAAGKTLSKAEISELVRMAVEAEFHGDDVPDLSFLDVSIQADPAAMLIPEPNRVPEPSTLLLLLVPACLLRRRRRR
jgi:hypothetical protein